MNKVIRTLCYFAESPSKATEERLNVLQERLEHHGYTIQMKRICSPNVIEAQSTEKLDDDILLSSGQFSYADILSELEHFRSHADVAFNIDLTSEYITRDHAEVLFSLMQNQPDASFLFAYTFNNPESSPFFPSAKYVRDGCAVGLQSTDLAEGCTSVSEWLQRMREVWAELEELLGDESDFLGLDSSVAPLGDVQSSLVYTLRQMGVSFSESGTTDTYLNITKYLKENNPRPIGLCGLMFPCLEDFELANMYEQGEFSIERNVFLSLHSGLGVDTYPIGMDEDPERVAMILRTLQKLSNKYRKPLSARFVSDGKARIGDCTDFGNPYLKDVRVRAL